jgi:hypothetical protein
MRLIGAVAACCLIAGGCRSHPGDGAGVGAARPVGDATAMILEPSASVAQQDRQIVRRGSMAIEVENVAAAQQRIESAVALLGGQVVQAQAREKDHAQYFLRVPSKALEALMDSVARVGAVTSRTVSAHDVTETVVDHEARLVTMRATRDRLRQLLDRATSIADVVSVERELARVQGELESLERRLNLLKSQVAMSDLSVDVRRRIVLGPLGLVFKGLGTVIGKLFVWR